MGNRIRHPSLRKGPRGGAIPSGRCSCDDPDLSTVKDVRAFGKALGTCSYCWDRGLDLMPFGSCRLHARCLLRRHGMPALILAESKIPRVRACCLSPRTFKKLLDAT
jgi:hypothetical protein